MNEISLQDGAILAPFFKDAYDTCAEAYLQGVMGRGFCDFAEQPTYGIIQMGNFCYLGGDGSGSHKKNILSILNALLKKSNLSLIPLSESWNQQLRENPSYQRVTRYALDCPNLRAFPQNKLSSYISKVAYDPNYVGASVSRRFIVKAIDESYYYLIRKQQWCRDFTANYANYPAFEKNGFGFVIIEGNNGKIASAASSFSTSLDSVEIEIATAPKYRQRGFGTAVSARMVMECLNRGKKPGWDASNLISVTIAEKLGYHFLEEYHSYVFKPTEHC